MTTHGNQLLHEVEEQKEPWLQGKTLLSAEKSVSNLRILAQRCLDEATTSAAEEVCRATRIAWMAIHGRALQSPILLSSETLNQAVAGIALCIKSIARADIAPDRRNHMEENMRLRSELITILKKDGLAGVNARLKQELQVA